MKNKEAVILAPVMPVWDEGQFCAPLVSLLERKGYSVLVIDTLSMIQDASPEKAIEKFSQQLNSQFQRPYLLIGFAMAGTLVQLLSPNLNNLYGVISISSPGFADRLLTLRLNSLISLLEKGEIDNAIRLLNQLVLPIGKVLMPDNFELPAELRASAINRMLIGFSLLLNMNVRDAIARYSGKFLAIVGEGSQLATWENQTHSSNSTHTYKKIANAGMRPWNDNPDAIDDLLNEWIEKL